MTEKFVRGAEVALRICRENNCTRAILKSKSPSCGCGQIHDGTFGGGLVPGNGIFAQMLLDEGIPVVTEQEYLNEPDRSKGERHAGQAGMRGTSF